MNEGLIVGVLSVIGSLYVFYIKIKNNIVKDEEEKTQPIVELNQSIIELNSTIKYLIDDVKGLKDKVTDHGKELEDLRLKVENLDTRMNMYHHN